MTRELNNIQIVMFRSEKITKVMNREFTNMLKEEIFKETGRMTRKLE